MAGKGGLDIGGFAGTPCKVSRRPRREQEEESRWWREKDLNSCSLCALVFYFHLRKGTACKKLLI